MTEHVRTVHEGKKRIYKEVNCQVKSFEYSFKGRMKPLLTKIVNFSVLWENVQKEMGFEHPHIQRAC